MAIPRKNIISLQDTSFYHCYSRCVRRAYLCGKDHLSGKDYSHRKTWITDRLTTLGKAFAIDICAYAVMSNHYHLVLRIDEEKTKSWSDRDVVEHWHSVYKGNSYTKCFIEGEKLSQAGKFIVQQCVNLWRQRLCNISWFMRSLNEFIAKEANMEDECTGRFWEGRFKSQALLDDNALLTCMVYVDLNPIRATIANTLKTSEHTSIQQRINERDGEFSAAKVPLMPMKTDSRAMDMPSLSSYITLVEWSIKIAKKEVQTKKSMPNLFANLKCDFGQYVRQTQHFEDIFARVAGTIESLRKFCNNHNLPWVRGVGERPHPT